MSARSGGADRGVDRGGGGGVAGGGGDRGGGGRSRTLAPLVAAGALSPGSGVLSCSVAGRDYYAGAFNRVLEGKNRLSGRLRERGLVSIFFPKHVFFFLGVEKKATRLGKKNGTSFSTAEKKKRMTSHHRLPVFMPSECPSRDLSTKVACARGFLSIEGNRGGGEGLLEASFAGVDRGGESNWIGAALLLAAVSRAREKEREKGALFSLSLSRDHRLLSPSSSNPPLPQMWRSRTSGQCASVVGFRLNSDCKWRMVMSNVESLRWKRPRRVFQSERAVPNSSSFSQ